MDGTAQAAGFSRPVLIGAVALAVISVGSLVTSVVAVTRAGGSGSSCSAAEVARRTMPSVVTVFAHDVSGRPVGSGSGQFMTAEGHVLTNDHVISPAIGGSLTIQRVTGEVLEATVVGRDIATDLAVLDVEGSGYPAIDFDEGPLRIGEQVFAVGAPLGLSDSLTSGVVSGLNRTITVPAEVGTAMIISGIQTDASINPGNSGGTLANCDGALVGVPTAGASVPDAQGVSSGGSIGIGFAIPAATARLVGEELIEHGSFDHATLGVVAVPVTDGESLSGLYVQQLVPSGAQEQGGLRVADVIVSVDGVPTASTDQLQAVLMRRSPGDEVPVVVIRDGSELTLDVTLGSSAGRA